VPSHIVFHATISLPLHLLIDNALLNPHLCRSMCTSPHGMTIFNALLTMRQPMQIQPVLLCVASMTRELIQHQIGHLIILRCLGSNSELTIDTILKQMQGSFMALAHQTFASKVVSQCLRQCSPAWVSAITMELCEQGARHDRSQEWGRGDRAGNGACARTLLTNPCGTFVLQTVLDVGSKEQIMQIMTTVRRYLPRVAQNVRYFWNRTFKQAWKKAEGRGSGGDNHLPYMMPPIPVQ